MLLIIAEGCPYCKELIEKIPKDKVKILDVTKDLKAAVIMSASPCTIAMLLAVLTAIKLGKSNK